MLDAKIVNPRVIIEEALKAAAMHGHGEIMEHLLGNLLKYTLFNQQSHLCFII